MERHISDFPIRVLSYLAEPSAVSAVRFHGDLAKVPQNGERLTSTGFNSMDKWTSDCQCCLGVLITESPDWTEIGRSILLHADPVIVKEKVAAKEDLKRMLDPLTCGRGRHRFDALIAGGYVGPKWYGQTGYRNYAQEYEEMLQFFNEGIRCLLQAEAIVAKAPKTDRDGLTAIYYLNKAREMLIIDQGRSQVVLAPSRYSVAKFPSIRMQWKRQGVF